MIVLVLIVWRSSWTIVAENYWDNNGFISQAMSEVKFFLRFFFPIINIFWHLHVIHLNNTKFQLKLLFYQLSSSATYSIIISCMYLSFPSWARKTNFYWYKLTMMAIMLYSLWIYPEIRKYSGLSYLYCPEIWQQSDWVSDLIKNWLWAIIILL